MTDDFKMLALTLYGEARGEPIEGIIAVGCVIRNRVTGTVKSYTDVCLANKQFSCWNKDDPNYAILIKLSSELDTTIDPVLRQCLFIANGIIGGDLLDNVHKAQHYVTTQLYQKLKTSQPDHWVNKMKVVSTQGHQVFLR